MWICTCGHQNADIGNYCVACGMSKNAATAAQLADDVAWFYYLGNQRMGPVSSREIAGSLHAGTLDRNTLIWKSGMPDWAPLHRTALSALAPHLMPPAPLQAVSDVYAWLLAVFPMAVGTVLAMLGVKYIGIALGIWSLTLLFWVLDVREIKKTTDRFDAWVWTIFLFMGVYLFIRASKAGQRYGYAIVWCVFYICFIAAYVLSR